MTNLAKQKIIMKDKSTLDSSEYDSFLNELPEWNIIERDGTPRVERSYTFKNFVEALDFTNQVGELAEEVNHHPVIVLTWGRATITWWSHDINGLNKNDFIMAARTDTLY